MAMTALKHVTRFEYGDALALEARNEGAVPVFGSNGVTGAHDAPNTLGPAIIVGRKGSFGKVTWTDLAAFCIDTAYYIDSRSTGADLRWLYWALQTLGLDQHSEDTGVPGLSREKAYQEKLRFPALYQQERIANFLDEKTARIDALIAEKEALAALLNEYFSAQLGKTFTQGIHAGQTVSQTGIEWLPTAPTTWRICKFTSLATIVRGASPRPAGDERYFNGNYIPWVTVAELTKDENIYLNATSSSLTEEGAKFSRKIKSGTLIFSNSGATLGVPKILSIDACANDGVLAFENLSPSLNIIYAYYYLSSLTENLRDRIRQGAGQPNLNTAIVKGIAIPLPHPREQVEIVSFIRALYEKRRSLLTHVNEHINLLSEYRSSLISAAVIGQLNIDEFQARQLEAA